MKCFKRIRQQKIEKMLKMKLSKIMFQHWH